MDRVRIDSVGEYFTFYGLAQNYRTGFTDRGLDVAWTLVIEASFYLVLPLFAWVVVRMARAVGSAAGRYAVALASAVAWVVVGMALRIWDIWFHVGTLSPRGRWFGLDQISRWFPATCIGSPAA